MNQSKQVKFFLLLSGVMLAITGCGEAKKQLGLTRQAPDEFAVVKRAPLAMPPDYTLRPPQPGAARPQEQAMDSQARQVVFGTEQRAMTSPGSAEAILLQHTGAVAADPSIRQVVDQETAALEPKEKPVAERLLGLKIGGSDQPPADVVDAKAEAERLRRNQEEGKPVTEGETPSIEE